MENNSNQGAGDNFRANGILLAAALGLVALANAFAAYFISQEHYVYFWDWAVYWNSYSYFSHALANEPANALRHLLSSIQSDDYNLLPVFPLSPFAWLFGTARLPYILAITNVALLPGIAILGLTATRAAYNQNSSHRYTWWLLACLAIASIPAIWSPVVRGWPDALGTLVIGLILLRVFTTPLEDQRYKHYFLCGLLLCTLVLTRRWYSFWAVAFFPAFVFAHALDIYRRQGLQWRHYLPLARTVCMIGVTFAVALFVIAKPFMLKAMETDYSDIYSAYRFANSTVDALKNLRAYYGWFQLLAATSGLLWLIADRKTRIFGTFLVVHTCLVFLMFTHTQDFAVQHHYLLVPALAIGIAVLVLKIGTGVTRRGRQAMALGLVFCGLFAGFSTVFFPGAAKISAMAGNLLPKIRTYPFSRNDMAELTGLLERLDELEKTEEGSIYVVASSDILNSSILQSACQSDSVSRDFCACIANTHDVDKRDGFPTQFMDATYIVLAVPTQYTLRAQDQRVIGLLARAVTDRRRIGASFQHVSRHFRLDRGVNVSVFKKVRPLNERALSALLAEFRKYYPDRPDMFSITARSGSPTGQCITPR